ncbi:MAG: ribulose-phosphate 3-epimerase [Acidobacteria bacterium]|nr:ribulose-phosphate 3-epimerase [Acidobacteriota bacterium]
MSVRIAPSILAADFARLGEQVLSAISGGAGLIHIDVMDGHFVPNITMGPLVVAAVKRVTPLPLDVHLMITDPDRYLDAFARAGATTITVHVEAAPDLRKTLARIRELGIRAGAAINPDTPVHTLSGVVDVLDHVIVMSVHPGFGGQAFIPGSLDKVRAVRDLVAGAGHVVDIEVDGGVDLTNAAVLAQAGATILVAGASVFGTPDPAIATQALLKAARAGVASA